MLMDRRQHDLHHSHQFSLATPCSRPTRKAARMKRRPEADIDISLRHPPLPLSIAVEPPPTSLESRPLGCSADFHPHNDLYFT
jgi:hypothetical protein